MKFMNFTSYLLDGSKYLLKEKLIESENCSKNNLEHFLNLILVLYYFVDGNSVSRGNKIFMITFTTSVERQLQFFNCKILVKSILACQTTTTDFDPFPEHL